MTVRLHLDLAAWRAHQQDRARAVEGLVPVAKGNGYGFGLQCLAAETARLGLSTLAVGTSFEVPQVRAAAVDLTGSPTPGWDGDVVVLTPWRAPHTLPSDARPGDEDVARQLADSRTIVTVDHLDDLRRLAELAPGTRVLVEIETSMRRHGIAPAEVTKVAPLLADLAFEGWTIHLPMVAAGRLAEARRLAQAAVAAVPGTVWLSHLEDAEYADLASELAARGVQTRLRTGTRLWLGAPRTRRTTATVLDLHPVRRGERVGYHHRLVPADGWVAVVSGGTAHGVGMEAPTSATTLRQRAIALATGSLAASGLALSPYTIGGRKRFFIEPPHMQSSLVFLPRDVTVPIGTDIPLELRLTTAHVDEIVIH